MSLGVKLAAETLGMKFESAFAADFDPAALRVYERNLEPAEAFGGDLSAVVRYRLSSKRPHGFVSIRLTHPALRRLEGEVDVLIGGPPCQGHSDLNNHSRRADPKNQLYLIMAALAAALNPRAVIIENVPGVVHDRSRVAETTELLLADMGYTVQPAVVSMGDLGIAQLRKRHALVAVRSSQLDVAGTLRALDATPRPVRWAISDLRSRVGSHFDEASRQSQANQRRIRWLFDNDEYDLPNPLRPPCHRQKEHTYVSMYGRMDWNSAAQTVTSGFGSPGQGRYVHPREQRTITPHEAARLQFFPDTFRFCPDAGSPPSRTELSRMIGNAVPPKMSYSLALAVSAALTMSAD